MCIRDRFWSIIARIIEQITRKNLVFHVFNFAFLKSVSAVGFFFYKKFFWSKFLHLNLKLASFGNYFDCTQTVIIFANAKSDIDLWKGRRSWQKFSPVLPFYLPLTQTDASSLFDFEEVLSKNFVNFRSWYHFFRECKNIHFRRIETISENLKSFWERSKPM